MLCAPHSSNNYSHLAKRVCCMARPVFARRRVAPAVKVDAFLVFLHHCHCASALLLGVTIIATRTGKFLNCHFCSPELSPRMLALPSKLLCRSVQYHNCAGSQLHKIVTVVAGKTSRHNPHLGYEPPFYHRYMLPQQHIFPAIISPIIFIASMSLSAPTAQAASAAVKSTAQNNRTQRCIYLLYWSRNHAFAQSPVLLSTAPLDRLYAAKTPCFLSHHSPSPLLKNR
jgi:hypothetical protein